MGTKNDMATYDIPGLVIEVVIVIGKNKVVVDHMINMVRGAVDEVDVVQCPIGVEVVAIAVS